MQLTKKQLVTAAQDEYENARKEYDAANITFRPIKNRFEVAKEMLDFANQLKEQGEKSHLDRI